MPRTDPAPDISTRGDAPVTRASLYLFGVMLFVLAAMLYFEFSVWVIMLVMFGLGGAVAAERRIRRLLKRGTFTWMRVARRPGKLVAAGDPQAAEAAYARALARARRFADNDSRRGVMLCELATYVKNQGRYPEVLALYEESAAILAQHLHDCPLDYLTTLNNFAIYYIHLRKFEAALQIMEKAVDLTFALKKPETTGVIYVAPAVLQPFQVLLHLNLAFLFIEMGELDEANGHLEAAGSLLPMLGPQAAARFVDHYHSSCAVWDCEAGNFTDADDELAQVANPNYPLCLRVRGMLARRRGQFAEAERLLRAYQEDQRRKGAAHRPEMLKVTLELAECAFGQDKHDEAFTSLQEARRLVIDFALPADAFWRSVLQTWTARAREIGKTDLAAALQSEMERVPAASGQAITILDKFRVHSTAAD